MTLLTAHKIFIATAAAMFAFAAVWELWNRSSGDTSTLLQGIGFAGAAIVLAIYLRWRCLADSSTRVSP